MLHTATSTEGALLLAVVIERGRIRDLICLSALYDSSGIAYVRVRYRV